MPITDLMKKCLSLFSENCSIDIFGRGQEKYIHKSVCKGESFHDDQFLTRLSTSESHKKHILIEK